MARTPDHFHDVMDSPTGPFVLEWTAGQLTRTAWLDRSEKDGSEPDGGWGERRLGPASVMDRFAAYFAGDASVCFDDIPTPSGPPFYRACWAACRLIPAGETRSYGELSAAAGGSPGSARAAGQAMKRNPTPILVPCHRVIGSTGDLHGFAGTTDRADARVCRKAKLLENEGWCQKNVPDLQLFPHNERPPYLHIGHADRASHSGSNSSSPVEAG